MVGIVGSGAAPPSWATVRWAESTFADLAATSPSRGPAVPLVGSTSGRPTNRWAAGEGRGAADAPTEPQSAASDPQFALIALSRHPGG